MRSKIFLIFILLNLVLFALVLFLARSDPFVDYVKALIQKQIPSEIEARIDFEGIAPKLFPPGVAILEPEISIERIGKFRYKEPIKSSFDEIDILFKANVFADAFSLEKISFQGSLIEVSLPEKFLNSLSASSEGNNKKPFPSVAELREALPFKIGSVEFLETELLLKKESGKVFFQGTLNEFSMGFIGEKLNVLLEAKDLVIHDQWNQLGEDYVALDAFQTNIDYEEGFLEVYHFAVSQEELSFVGEGEFDLSETWDETSAQYSAVFNGKISELTKYLQADLEFLNGQFRIEVSSSGKFSDPSLDFKIEGEEVFLQEWKFSKINLIGKLEKLQIKSEVTEGTLGEGRFTGDLSFDLSEISEQLSWNANLSLDNVDLKKALGPVGGAVDSMFTSIQGEAKLDVVHDLNRENDEKRRDKIEVSGSIVSEKLRVRGESEDLFAVEKLPADFSLSITPGQVVLKNAVLNVEDTLIEGQGSFTDSKGYQMDFKSVGPIDLAYLDEFAGTEIKGKSDLDVKLRGPEGDLRVGLTLNATNAEYVQLLLGDLEGKINYFVNRRLIEFEELKGRQGPLSYSGKGLIQAEEKKTPTMDFQFNVSDGSYRSLVKLMDPLIGDITWLPKEVYGALRGEVSIKGPTDPRKFVIESSLEGNDFRWQGEYFPKISSQIGLERGRLYFEEIKVQHEAGLLSGFYEVNLFTGKDLEFSLLSDELPIEQFRFWKRTGLQLTGDIQGEYRGQGTLKDYNTQGKLVLRGLEARGTEFPGGQIAWSQSGSLWSVNSELFDRKLTLSGDWDFSGKENGNLRLKADRLDLAPIFYVFSSSNLTDPSFRAFLNMRADLSFPASRWKAMVGSVRIQDLSLRKTGFFIRNTEPIELVSRASGLRLTNASFDGPGSRIDLFADGSLAGNFALEARGEIKAEFLELFIGHLQRSWGRMLVELRLEGSPKQELPHLISRVTLDQVGLRISRLASSIENMQGKIVSEGETFKVQSLTADFGGGSLQGSGDISFSSSLPELNLRLAIQEARFDFLENSFARVDGVLRFEGDAPPYRLAGSMQLTNAIVRDDFDYQKSLKQLRAVRYLPRPRGEQALSSLVQTDVTIRSAGNTFIRNNIMDLEFQGDIRALGRLNDLRYKGALSLIQGQLLFKDSGFVLDTGEVRFQGDYEMNPEFRISGETEVSEYTVFLYAAGTVKNYKIELNSKPSLPQREILSLLALGVTGEEFRQAGQEGAGLLAQTELGYLLLEQTEIGKEMQNRFGINVQVAPTVGETEGSSLTGRSLTPGQADDERTIRSGAKVVVRKDLSDKVSVQFGSVVGEAEETRQELDLEYELNETVSVEGNYQNQGRESGKLRGEGNSLGLDLKFRWEF